MALRLFIDTLNNLFRSSNLMVEPTFLGLALDQWLVIFTAAAAFFGAIATILLVWMRSGDRKAAKDREAAEWLREYIEIWDGYLGRVYISSNKGKIVREPQTEPSHFLGGSRGRKRLNHYSPGFWKTWVELSDEKKKQHDELYGFYESVLLSLKEGILSEFGNILVNKERLISNIAEDALRRSRHEEGITFISLFVEGTDERRGSFSLRAREINADIARGDESRIAALLIEIRLHQDLPITHDLIDNLIQINQDSIESKFYRVKQKAIQSLETKFGLPRRIAQ